MEEKKEQKKLSYEDLQRIAGDLSQQNQKMVQQIQKMQEALQSREFDYTSFFLSMLFKVMEHPELYSDEFVPWCTKNIESLLIGFANAINPQEPEKEQKDEA